MFLYMRFMSREKPEIQFCFVFCNFLRKSLASQIIRGRLKLSPRGLDKKEGNYMKSLTFTEQLNQITIDPVQLLPDLHVGDFIIALNGKILIYGSQESVQARSNLSGVKLQEMASSGLKDKLGRNVIHVSDYQTRKVICNGLDRMGVTQSRQKEKDRVSHGN